MSKTALRLPAPPAKRRRLQPLQRQQERVEAPPDTPDKHGDEECAEEREAPGALPNDTMAALQLLKSRFPREAKVTPFATRAQLYTVLADRTLADRQLEELRRRNSVRLLQLPASRDECVVMLTADYEVAVQRCKTQLQAAHVQKVQDQQQHSATGNSAPSAAPSAPSALQVFDWFLTRVLPACTDVMITHHELLQLLAGQPAGRAGSVPHHTQRPHPASAITDQHFALLLSEGLLTRHTNGTDGYLFSMPSAGAAVRSVAAGRQEILSLLQRRRVPELLEAELLKRKLQRSVLGPAWHITDMIGGGTLLRRQTTVGALLRAAKRTG